MKKTLQIALVCLIMVGCSSTLKQGWNDFTAYYNTFYNAKQYYNEGLKKNQRQAPPINPQQPIRIHQPPTSAGFDDFEHAIEKGSSILRNHNESKFVNPAVALIGKSFFYRQEFFAALEKFQELQSLGNHIEQQEAILWQGRTYLEMSNYSEGVRFLEIELDLFDDWEKEIRAEIGLVLVQLYVSQGNLEGALNYMQGSIDNLENSKLKSRAYFLFGQIFERVDRDTQALIAYRQIREIRTDFDLEYNALRKEAELTRKTGDYERASALFRELERDDKFIDYREELQYEVAKTYQMRGQAVRALELYERILRDRYQTPEPTTKAKIFYGIAEIYRDHEKDFQMAAAYYDSAASERVDSSLMPEHFNARELADSFGEYATIKQQISHNDSLLYLGSLEGAALDSVLAEIQSQRLEALERENRRARQAENRSINIDEPDEIIEAAEATEHGFLNINNPVKIQESSLQFQAVWGDRPLADNWRRRADVSGSRFEQIVITDTEDEEIEITPEDEAQTAHATGVDMSEIPFEEEQKKEIREKTEQLHYQLGNVFYLSLEMPDSAKTHFNYVLESSINPDFTMRSLYTLAEIELMDNNLQQAENWFDKLSSEFPNSVFTERIAIRLGKEVDRQTAEEVEGIKHQYLTISETGLTAPERAEKLREIAKETDGDRESALIFFEAAKEYAKAARQQQSGETGINEWFRIQEELQNQKKQFQALRDSANVMLNDTTITDEEVAYWNQISDSTFTEPDLVSEFPFEGAYWDSTRSVLNHIEAYYASSQVMTRARILKQTIEKPESNEPDMPVDTGEEQDEVADETVASCEESGILIDMDGGLNAFMSSITFPSWTDDISMRGEITYKFTVEPDGSVADFEQVSRMDRSGIPQSIENAIEQLLHFTPTEQGTSVECTLTFPIDL